MTLCVAPVGWDQAGPCAYPFCGGQHEQRFTERTANHVYVPPVSRVCGHPEDVHVAEYTATWCKGCDNGGDMEEQHAPWHAFMPAEEEQEA